MVDSPGAAQSPLHLSVGDLEHAPTVPSPLNPASRQPSKTPAPHAAPIQREQREKKDSLKKRESAANGSTASSAKRKAAATHTYPSPQRFNVPPPRAQDFEEPKDDSMMSHEPFPLYMPDSERQLYKPIDLAENKRGYRYSRAIADPLFPHKQYYRATSPPPHYARMSFEDADKWMHFTTNALITTNEKGWRMARSNVCAREGSLYYEVKIHRGVPAAGPNLGETGPQPYVRFGWARREAPLDAPVGFDGYSYGVTDVRFETMHRSRPGKFFHPKKAKAKPSVKGPAAAPTTITLAPEDQHVKEGDVIGVEIQLPSLSLQQKIVSGVYNPAVDAGDGFDHASSAPEAGTEPADVIRDRIPVPYKGNSYFEVLDHVASKPMEIYSDRTTNLNNLPTSSSGGAAQRDGIKAAPNPNHESPSLRTLPHSAMRVYKNGKLVGTAFENLLAFLPPASAPAKGGGAREGFDDGLVGYFPAVSCFFGGIAEVNFGDTGSGFWCPPSHLRATTAKATATAVGGGGATAAAAAAAVPVDHPQQQQHPASSSDPGMEGVATQDMATTKATSSSTTRGWNPGRQLRGIGERYKEQVAEDVVWDIIDEVDFFVQDGGFEGEVGAGGANGYGVIGEKSGRLKSED